MLFSIFTFKIFDKTHFDQLLAALRQPKKNSKKPVDAFDIAGQDIEEMRRECEALDIRLLFILLPDKRFVRGISLPHYPGVITLNPKELSEEDYTLGLGDHPLNSGHAKIAKQILGFLSEN